GLGGWLHDVGKIAVPDQILTKRDSLSDEEWELVQRHPVVGAELLRNFPELASACPGVRHHHERWDGRGYPDGLAGEEIPLEARIVAVCDAFRVMVEPRPYRPVLDREAARAELERCSGTQFDPSVVTALLRVLDAEVDSYEVWG